MTWLSELEKDAKWQIKTAHPKLSGARQQYAERALRMARVIRALVRFIKLNIDFDAPLRPVGLSNLPPDAKELINKIEE